MTNVVDNKRIVKNTFYLYIRMIMIMGVNLFTSRVILQILGVEDYGIYNVVAGIVVLFTFLNSALSSATQRYLSYFLGLHNFDKLKSIFNTSLICHILIAVAVLILSETIGLWVLRNMNFPLNRIEAVNWTYQFAVFTCVVQILRVPFNAVIIAYEQMSFYAWISIAEVLLSLAIVYVLLLCDGDRLILYSFLLFLIKIIVGIIYKLYCNNKYPITHFIFIKDTALLKQIVSFSSWSLFGSLANVGAQQGINMIINIFCGVLVNAAVGISSQVMSAVGMLLGNFQTAFNPQIVKAYATGDMNNFILLIYRTSKFSYFLLFLLSFPLLINCTFFLQIWLGNVPHYTTEFTFLMIIFLLLDAISGPLWISVQAIGKIKKYQILISFLIFLNIPFAILILDFGFSPIYVFLGRVIINFITILARISYLQRYIRLSIYDFIKQVFSPIILVTSISFPIPFFLNVEMSKDWLHVLFLSILCLLNTAVAIYLVGITKQERVFLKQILYKKSK